MSPDSSLVDGQTHPSSSRSQHFVPVKTTESGLHTCDRTETVVFCHFVLLTLFCTFQHSLVPHHTIFIYVRILFFHQPITLW